MFLYKYSASFRLHSLKELMKSNPTYSHSDCPSTFNSGFDRKFCFDGYLLQRSSRVIAEDIRTFWSLNKNSKFHSVFVLTKKELFSPWEFANTIICSFNIPELVTVVSHLFNIVYYKLFQKYTLITNCAIFIPQVRWRWFEDFVKIKYIQDNLVIKMMLHSQRPF